MVHLSQLKILHFYIWRLAHFYRPITHSFQRSSLQYKVGCAGLMPESTPGWLDVMEPIPPLHFFTALVRPSCSSDSCALRQRVIPHWTYIAKEHLLGGLWLPSSSPHWDFWLCLFLASLVLFKVPSSYLYMSVEWALNGGKRERWATGSHTEHAHCLWTSRRRFGSAKGVGTAERSDFKVPLKSRQEASCSTRVTRANPGGVSWIAWVFLNLINLMININHPSLPSSFLASCFPSFTEKANKLLNSGLTEL